MDGEGAPLPERGCADCYARSIGGWAEK